MLPYYSFPFVPQVNNPYMTPYNLQANPGFSNTTDMPDMMEDYDQVYNSPEFWYDRQPNPVTSDNPAQANIVLFKELTGYPNYGNPSGNADILYTGNRGTWTFEIQPFLFVPGNLRAQIIIRAVLDDHTNVQQNRYSATITVNGRAVHRGRVNLPHGSPAGQQFNNWRLLTFDVPNLRRSNSVVIENTSTTGPNDWIAFDWMELRLVSR